MPTTTTTYSFNKPVVGADEDDWGGYLNGNWDSVDDLLDGTTPVTGIDINSGTLDGVTIGGTTAGAGTFTTLTANTSITGTLATAAQPNITSVGTLTSLTVSGDVSFGDNDKAIFGDGPDLQIYHTGTASYIQEYGTGDLFIAADTNVNITNTAATETKAVFTSNGSVDLYYDNSKKLATTSTGVDITGTLTSDGLTVEDGDPTLTLTDTDGSTTTTLKTVGANTELSNPSSGNLRFRTNALELERMRISPDGDISFYEDTGTTAKFFWDASAEALALGTATSVSNNRLVIDQASGDGQNSGFYMQRNGGAGTSFKIDIDSSDVVNLRRSATTALAIDSSGNVGIGTSSPADILHVGGSSNQQIRINSSKNPVYVGAFNNSLNLAVNRRTVDGSIINADRSAAFISLNGDDGGSFITVATANANNTSPTEAMRIDSSGNVGIGTSSPTSAAGYVSLSVNGSSTGSLIDSYQGGTVYGRLRALANEYAVLAQGASTPLVLGTQNTERMRIDSSGNLLVGTTAVGANNSNSASIYKEFGQIYLNHSGLANGTYYAAFTNAGGIIGSITQATTSSVSYNTSSDYRLKENVVELTGATTRLKQLEPKRFNFIADADTTVDGFLAHEVQSVVPEAITGEYNEVDADGNPVYQGIDQSKLVPLLVATIKELEARITALENA